jgi:formate dehydrogenase subunit beta
MDVPVSQVFALAGDEVQRAFDYVPGRNTEEPIPMLTYEEDELHEYEDAKGPA